MVETTLDPRPANRVSPETRAEIELFLYEEADLLDQWRLHEWLELFTPEAHYLVPSTDLPDGNRRTDLFLVQDDRFLLEQRVNSLLTRAAHAQYPHSRTRRFTSNVRAEHLEGDIIRVHASFLVVRARNGAVDNYVGSYRHLVEPDPGSQLGYRYLERKAVLDLESLRPHGKVSVLL